MNPSLCNLVRIFNLFIKYKTGAQLTTSLSLMADLEKRAFGTRHGVFLSRLQGLGVHHDACSENVKTVSWSNK